MHCTVKPGKNCIFTPSEAAKFKSIQLRQFRAAAKNDLSSPGGQDAP
jgi:hypothetical protein